MEIEDHSKSWRNISNLLKQKYNTFALYFNALNAYAFTLQNILKCI